MPNLYGPTRSSANAYRQMGYNSPEEAARALSRVYGNTFNRSSRLQRLVDEANAANQAREDEIRGLYDTMLGNVGQFGQTERELIGRDFNFRRSQSVQDSIGRGLFNSTVHNSMINGLNDRERFQQQALGERLAGMRNALLGDKARFVERIEDVGPNLGLYANAQRAASAAPGGGVLRPLGGRSGRASGSRSIYGVSSDFLKPKRQIYSRAPRTSASRPAPGSNPRASNYYGQRQAGQTKLIIDQRRAMGLPSYQPGVAGTPRLPIDPRVQHKFGLHPSQQTGPVRKVPPKANRNPYTKYM